jgi:rod shape-determining protein MreD
LERSETKILSTVITALIAVLLQIVLAPSIAIAGVVPNFVLIAVVISAMHNNPIRSTVLGFILGLVFDFTTQGPIGCMTLILTLLGFGVSSINKGAFTGGLLVNTIILLLAALAGELFNSIVYAIIGIDSEFLYSLLVKVLPATVYDCICGLIALLVYNLVSGNNTPKHSNSQGRSLHRKLN